MTLLFPRRVSLVREIPAGDDKTKSFFYDVACGFPFHSTQHKPLTGVISNLFSTLRMYSHFLNKSFFVTPTHVSVLNTNAEPHLQLNIFQY
jgi:hypothetical protein